jgi:metalloendopeptidase OMA1, mitochondrial
MSLPASILLLLCALLCQCATPAPRSSPPAGPSLQRVSTRLAAAVPIDRQDHPIRWSFAVRETSGINARSWPDGRIELTSGALAFVKNDAELAAVAAHEMAHVYCRHGRQRALETWAVLLGGAALATILTTQDIDSATALGTASAAVLTLSLTTLNARRHQQEYEADQVSLDLLRRAGYPPQAAVRFWERYAALRAKAGLGSKKWWKAHPPDADRLQRLRHLAANR